MSEGRIQQFNEGRSIHVGLDRVDDAVYQGWLERLGSSELDARAMRELASAMGFATRLLLSEDATRENVLAALESTIERLVDGDVLLLTYSGHMTSLAGLGDDRDGWDEAWCLHDGILLDDQFHDLLADVPAGADVLVITDSCFASGIVDGTPRQVDVRSLGPGVAVRPLGTHADGAGVAATAGGGAEALFSPEIGERTKVTRIEDARPRAPATRLGDLAIDRLVRQRAIPYGRARPASQRREITARVVALAAAAEGSLAFEGDGQGFFTAALLEAVEQFQGAPLSYGALMDAVSDMLRVQKPTLGVFGSADASVIQAAAFGVSSATPGLRGTKASGMFLKTPPSK